MSTRIRTGDIVVATDGSRHAEDAVTWAAEQASLEHRRLLVVTVTDGSPSGATTDAVHRAHGGRAERVGRAQSSR